MCGIAGFIAGHGAANAAALAPMLARIAHRGPDGQGTFVEGPAALGHCRLAIIDLEGGAQPLYSEDKNLVVVFNGEIYNYRALTAELTALGHTFATRTDTETGNIQSVMDGDLDGFINAYLTKSANGELKK